jgi:hypothetical protein
MYSVSYTTYSGIMTCNKHLISLRGKINKEDDIIKRDENIRKINMKQKQRKETKEV